jgi:hypothetical protein
VEARSHRLLRDAPIVQRRESDYARLRIPLGDGTPERQPALVREPDVDEDDVEALAFEDAESVGAPVRDLGDVALQRLERRPKRVGEQPLVFDD